MPLAFGTPVIPTPRSSQALLSTPEAFHDYAIDYFDWKHVVYQALLIFKHHCF